jgi:hypothetical protein
MMNIDPDKLYEDSIEWLGWMLLTSIVAFGVSAASKILFGIVGQNITFNVRKNLYQKIL